MATPSFFPLRPGSPKYNNPSINKSGIFTGGVTGSGVGIETEWDEKGGRFVSPSEGLISQDRVKRGNVPADAKWKPYQINRENKTPPNQITINSTNTTPSASSSGSASDGTSSKRKSLADFMAEAKKRGKTGKGVSNYAYTMFKDYQTRGSAAGSKADTGPRISGMKPKKEGK
jgi:hypothetical protein